VNNFNSTIIVKYSPKSNLQNFSFARFYLPDIDIKYVLWLTRLKPIWHITVLKIFLLLLPHQNVFYIIWPFREQSNSALVKLAMMQKVQFLFLYDEKQILSLTILYNRKYFVPY